MPTQAGQTEPTLFEEAMTDMGSCVKDTLAQPYFLDSSILQGGG